MPRGHKSNLRAHEKRHQNRGDAQSLKSAPGTAGEEEEAACSSSSVLGDAPSSSAAAGALQASPSAPATSSTTAGVSCKRADGKAKDHAHKTKNSSGASTFTKRPGLNILSQKVNKLVQYILNQYKMKVPIKKVDMLKIVHKWYKKDFSEVLRKASNLMDLVYGLEVKEVKPTGNFYTLVHNQDDTSDGSLSTVWRFPTKGILMPLLSMIFLNGDHTPEEEVWKFLEMMDIYSGKFQFIWGEPRKLITQDLVWEEYLVYQQVANSDPPRCEFLWAPRAHTEMSKMKILEFVAKLNDSEPTDLPCIYQEVLRDEEERAQARAQAEPRAGSPSKASGHPTAISSHSPHPE